MGAGAGECGWQAPRATDEQAWAGWAEQGVGTLHQQGRATDAGAASMARPRRTCARGAECRRQGGAAGTSMGEQDGELGGAPAHYGHDEVTRTSPAGSGLFLSILPIHSLSQATQQHNTRQQLNSSSRFPSVPVPLPSTLPDPIPSPLRPVSFLLVAGTSEPPPHPQEGQGAILPRAATRRGGRRSPNRRRQRTVAVPVPPEFDSVP
ncbi:hypothetical protein ZWY2020_044864 [Hordeum vulgare]|nr:hypothetical protein ZWY2020_044864 [Hordeum vulgare]